MPTPQVDMLGEEVCGGQVVRQVPSIGHGARWEVLLPCGHKQIFERKGLRDAVKRKVKTLHCQTCNPRRSSW
jgi:hypothetical protein